MNTCNFISFGINNDIESTYLNRKHSVNPV